MSISGPESSAKLKSVVLVGNPNVGKSVIFNALTGRYVTVSNYPGTTVEISKSIGTFGNKKFYVIDTPGINSLVVNSEDEKVTKEILSKKDEIACVIQVADSKNLRRTLLLTLELLELKLPLVLDLNMSDEAKERGIIIDIKKLSEKLGIEVIETVAIVKEGIAKLKEAVLRAKASQLKIDNLESQLNHLVLLKKRIKLVDDLIKEALQISGTLNKGISDIIGKLTTTPKTGIPILLLILVVMYLFVGKLAASKVVDFLESIVFEKYINPTAKDIIYRFIPINFLQELLVGEYGIITMAFTYAFAIIFPIVTAFFIFFGILEDSGYLPRISVLSNRIFNKLGLNGRAVLPMMLGLGCGTMATLTSRILETKKEKILVTLLLSLAIPCSAQLGVIMGMLGGLSIKALLIWLGVILLTIIIVGYFASKIIPGERAPFIQEIPPIRIPHIGNILIKTFTRLKWYLKEAVPLFVMGTLLLFLLNKLTILKWIEKFLNPLVTGFLKLPPKVSEVFIVGFLRRDYGAAGLYILKKNGLLNNIQVLVSLVVITLFVPCIAQFFIIIKERGLKIAIFIGIFVFVFAFLVGGILNQLLDYLTNNLKINII